MSSRRSGENMLRLASFVLWMAMPVALARPAPNDDCHVPAIAASVAIPSELPLALVRAMGDVALPGEPFDTSDVHVKGHKYSRYIFVWHAGARWIVATEQGGIALHTAVFVYRLASDGKTATLIDKRTGLAGSACETATRLAGR